MQLRAFSNYILIGAFFSREAYAANPANQMAIKRTRVFTGSVDIVVGLTTVKILFSFHAYIFAILKRKNVISVTPLNDALKALILALKDSAAAFVLRLTKKFSILS